MWKNISYNSETNGKPHKPKVNAKAVNQVTKNYENDLSIFKSEENINQIILFDSPQASTKDKNLIVKSLNPKTATGSGPIFKSKTAANIIDSYLANIMNNDLKQRSQIKFFLDLF